MAPNRRLIFENHHQSRIAAYLVNCLVPHDRDIRFVAQNRNQQQSFYQLDYVQAGVYFSERCRMAANGDGWASPGFSWSHDSHFSGVTDADRDRQTVIEI